MNALKKLLVITCISLLISGCGQKKSEVDSQANIQDSLSNQKNFIQQESLEESHDLIDAVLENDLEKTQKLLCQGANIHQKDARGWEAIHHAASKGNIEIITLLLQYKADVNAKTLCPLNSHLYEYKNDHYTPLLAAASGQLETIQYLIEHGAHLNDKEELGNTALHFAEMDGNTETVAYLLKHGADVNASNNHGDTPLLEAIVGREYEHDIVELLLNNSADINACNDQQETCLLKALDCNFNLI